MNGAVEEADQRLPKPCAVGEQRSRQRFELKVEVDALRARFLRGIRRRVDELFRIDGRQLQLQVARQQTPGIDDFVDELELLFGLADDRFARAHVARLIECLSLDELGPANNAVERSAQIVRDHAQVIVGKPVDFRLRSFRRLRTPFRWSSRLECSLSFDRPLFSNLFPSSYLNHPSGVYVQPVTRHSYKYRS